jgi:hypothetical protein
MMAQLTDGQRYRLPTGQLVVARQTPEGFFLEFRRKYASPIIVDPLGILTLNGEAMRLTVDCLIPDYSENDGIATAEMNEVMQMVLDIHERGGEIWELLREMAKDLHGKALGLPKDHG